MFSIVIIKYLLKRELVHRISISANITLYIILLFIYKPYREILDVLMNNIDREIEALRENTFEKNIRD